VHAQPQGHRRRAARAEVAYSTPVADGAPTLPSSLGSTTADGTLTAPWQTENGKMNRSSWLGGASLLVQQSEVGFQDGRDLNRPI